MDRYVKSFIYCAKTTKRGHYHAVKTPIVCLLFMIYMIGFYYRKPHIPVESTKIFQILTKVALLNVLFDFITV